MDREHSDSIGHHDNNNDNTATRLRRLLESDEGHSTWGSVIYRCIYSPDSDRPWSRLLDALKRYTREALQRYRHDDGATALSKFTLTTIEDSTLLDGSTTHVAREHFRAWSSEAIARE
ncbi:hypothetical protein B0T21DRAFT_417309 [Apiosordaria backusii]|uniref:Uncharacterized protein n=1 Tax=Apiosordaria backusii TaxID=314023 RepID=A0AA39ZPC2_9PEZI|nr:hypothetical protein B0T21DRAFT_417309 [Apiosordaria backusii]